MREFLSRMPNREMPQARRDFYIRLFSMEEEAYGRIAIVLSGSWRYEGLIDHKRDWIIGLYPPIKPISS